MKSKSNTSIDWDVEVGGGGAAIEAVTADGANTPTDNTVPANLRIGRYRIKHQFPISRIDIAEAASRAPQDLQDLFSSHVDRGLTHILRKMNDLVFTGDGTGAGAGEVIGLTRVLDDTYNYAGINVTTYPAWKAIKNSNAGTPRALSKNLLLALEETTKIQETGWNMIVCHPTMGTRYNQLFDTLAGSVALANVGDPLKQVELGHGRRTYNGAPIIEDPACPTGQIIFMDTADVDVFSFAVANNPSPMSQRETSVPQAWGLNINVAELPSMNSAKRNFEIYVLPQMRVYNRKSIQAITDLS